VRVANHELNAIYFHGKGPNGKPLRVRERTSVNNGWIAARLAMGHPGSVSRILGACKNDAETESVRIALAKEIDQVGKKYRR
jgi:hypothetical protein